MSLRHKRTKATQQDLGNHILLCRTNGIRYVRYSLAPATVKLGGLCAKSLCYTGNITLPNNYQNFPLTTPLIWLPSVSLTQQDLSFAFGNFYLVLSKAKLLEEHIQEKWKK